ncbi:MAG: hypothetical protein H6733_14355 [Alphaproteobacteria bacterium]|nr:hypothetical protein [Alphaproteobacteria bacterium]
MSRARSVLRCRHLGARGTGVVDAGGDVDGRDDLVVLVWIGTSPPRPAVAIF